MDYYKMISEYYSKGYYTQEDVYAFVPKFITKKQADYIIANVTVNK